MQHTLGTPWGGRTVDRYVLANGMTLEHTYFTSYWQAREKGETKKQGAVYVSGAKEPETFEPMLKHTLRGEDLEMDALWDLHNKFIVAYQREELEKVKASPDFADLPEQLRAVFESKWRFDRYAGCTCPCSPGWIPGTRDKLGYGGYLRVSSLAHEAEVQRKIAEAQAERERKAAERGFESVQAMQKADAEEWQRKCEEQFEAAAAKAREADEARWAASAN